MLSGEISLKNNYYYAAQDHYLFNCSPPGTTSILSSQQLRLDDVTYVSFAKGQLFAMLRRFSRND